MAETCKRPLDARPNGTKSARVIQVIETKSARGFGTEKDPVRTVVQYWDFEGNFLAEMDTEFLIPQIEHEARVTRDTAALIERCAKALMNSDSSV